MDLLDNAAGQLLVKLLGEEAGWILMYQLPEGPAHTIATMPPDTIITILEEHAAALRGKKTHGLTLHRVDGKPS